MVLEWLLANQEEWWNVVMGVEVKVVAYSPLRDMVDWAVFYKSIINSHLYPVIEALTHEQGDIHHLQDLPLPIYTLAFHYLVHLPRDNPPLLSVVVSLSPSLNHDSLLHHQQLRHHSHSHPSPRLVHAFLNVARDYPVD